MSDEPVILDGAEAADLRQGSVAGGEFVHRLTPAPPAQFPRAELVDDRRVHLPGGAKGFLPEAPSLRTQSEESDYRLLVGAGPAEQRGPQAAGDVYGIVAL